MGYLTRDIPSSMKDLTYGWIVRAKNETVFSKNREIVEESPEEDSPHDRSEVVFKILTAGSGLFSDGYVNNSISTASTCLSTLYPKEVGNSSALSNVSSIAFVGTIVGQLSFGYISDKFSRKLGMLISSALLILFSILCAASYGGPGNIEGMLIALTVYRFFLGIGIGSEYPTGSVACAEASAMLPAKKRNRYFCWFTNFSIDVGFVCSALVPFVLLLILKEKRLDLVWRLTLGIGAVFPLALFLLRTKFKEDKQFKKTGFQKVGIPYLTVLKFYWFRLIVVALIWFVYDFCTYAFGLYSSFIIKVIIPDGDLVKTFGWNIVLNVFYIPGAFLGAVSSDYLGPRLTLVIGLLLQATFGIILGALFPILKHNIAGFVIIYGIFMTMGEFGPGDNIGILASKTSATSIRGTYYSVAAAIGKVGAFTGTYIFPIIIKRFGGAESNSGMQAPYFIASILAIIAALAGLIFLPDVSPSAMSLEDNKFLEYLASTGFDMSSLGSDDGDEEEDDISDSVSEYIVRDGSGKKMVIEDYDSGSDAESFDKKKESPFVNVREL
ncbi:hypothetical protein DASC09_008100 [Saccharomycopsis crataegensis]|uniref:Major facilitator superfamily (MFS) profile domain-containing protein n=1 Tax=Saccharomycopsis crataegensis TaxID=43959 RepID=A0AAV5QGF9_9ASCO|nr:hypothetical protein DASC09_008100 [Saccharomycopsis crataegensis]